MRRNRPALRAAENGGETGNAPAPVTPSEAGSEADMRKTFNLFDEDGSGFISPEEFRKVMKKLNKKKGKNKVSDAEIEDMIRKADADHDGEISYDE